MKSIAVVLVVMAVVVVVVVGCSLRVPGCSLLFAFGLVLVLAGDRRRCC